MVVASYRKSRHEHGFNLQNVTLGKKVNISTIFPKMMKREKEKKIQVFKPINRRLDINIVNTGSNLAVVSKAFNIFA